MPGADHHKTLLEIGCPASPTLNLPAGRLWNTANPEQQDSVGLYTMVFSDGLANPADDLVEVEFLWLRRLQIRLHGHPPPFRFV